MPNFDWRNFTNTAANIGKTINTGVKGARNFVQNFQSPQGKIVSPIPKQQNMNNWQQRFRNMNNWAKAVQEVESKTNPQVMGTQYRLQDIKPLEQFPKKNNPYYGDIPRTWKGVNPVAVHNVMAKESSFRPTIAHINRPNSTMNFTRDIQSEQQLNELLNTYPSVDLGLMQLNTAPAMGKYLKNQGMSWYDLMDPLTNLQVAYDLYAGDIPKTSSGWGNWYAAQDLGYTK